MSLNNNLVSSWNFDTVTGSNNVGSFVVDDISNENIGQGTGFTASTSSMVLKEDIKTGRKQNYETLEGIDTIQLVDTDDERVSGLEKPSSVKLMVENSMYQIVSDEMLNLFASIEDYAFKFSLPDNKYKSEYEQLINARKLFFSKVLEKPNLEKYIEFYKWIDSSLGALIDQLKPENSSDFSGLKTTVESHILEKNKYQHALPITIGTNKIYTNPDKSITVIKSTNGNAVIDGQSTAPHKQPFLQDNIPEVVKIANTSKNFSENYEIVQTAGKTVNNRGQKANKTVFQTRFSAGDGLSEINRYDSTNEYSVYNELNQKAGNVRSVYNLSQSQLTGTQGANTTASSTTIANFADNPFVQRNIPYTASNYHESGIVYYEQIPSVQTENRQRNNILIESANGDFTVIEPPVEYAVPAKHVLRTKNAFENIEVYSPYNSKIDTFTPRTLQQTGTTDQGFTAYFGNDTNTLPDDDTFFKKIETLPTGQIQVKSVEILQNIYPRKDLMGRAETRTKPDYEEVSGTFSTSALTWSQNSYNNNTADVRSFWRDSIVDRRRTRGIDVESKTGSINCIGQFNLSGSSTIKYLNGLAGASPNYNFLVRTGAEGNWYLPLTVLLSGNLYNSTYPLDSNLSMGITDPSDLQYSIATNEIGDLSPYNHAELVKFILNSSSLYDYTPTAKPQFIQNNFGGFISQDKETIGMFTIPSKTRIISNASYQYPKDTNIKPFYDSYSSFFENIKHKSLNHSIIPEYAVSFDTGTITGRPNNNKNSYLKLLGNENYQIYDEASEYFISDFNKFFNKQSNKIKFTLNGVKKLLPYNGFYPQTHTSQIIKEFYKGYLSSSNISSREAQALMQPFFSPGILFNTIKSGLAVDFPIRVSETPVIYSDLYTGSLTQFLTSSQVKTLDLRVPFEAIIDPYTNLFNAFNNSNDAINIAYLDPTHYNNIFLSGNTNIIYPTGSFSKVTQSANTDGATFVKNYQYIINNFLAEVPNFFLKQGQLTNFISAPESQFGVMQSGSEYAFNITIVKNSNFSMFKKIGGGTNEFPEHSLFGPPVRNATASGGSNTSIFRQDAYAPFCPPYLNADNVPENIYHIPYNSIKISFIPEETRQFTLEEILNGLTITKTAAHTFNYAKNNSMFLDRCLNFKKKLEIKQTKFDAATGKPIDITDSQSDYKWLIQTKFETPLIDYNDTISSSSVSLTSNESSSVGGIDSSTITLQINQLNGIWHDYGTIPKDGQSVQLFLEDSKTGNSLLDIVKFKKETKSIGALAESKTISEAIVLLPYTEARNNNTTYNITEDKHLFKIPRKLINSLLGVSNYTSLTIEKIKTLLDTNSTLDRNNSIIDLMIKMVNNNIPPHLNWLYDPNIQPFVMYIGEFTHVLSKQDLADIWQANMPEIARIPEEQTIEVEHFLGDNELFGGIDINKYDIKLKVFKVKKRASTKYDDLLNNVSDNQQYNFATNTTDIPWYTYNWPYDYFSLVELVNVQAGEVYESTGSA